jgi:preprotein translocase subunit YajC
MVESLKNGDKVITQGGLYGVVKGVTEQVVQVRIADGVQIEVARHAISGLQNPPGE